MPNCVKTNVCLGDVSLRFCSCCLKKFSPHPSELTQDRVYMFLPTIDVYNRAHFAYVEVPVSVIERAHYTDQKVSFNLAEVGNVLHLEMGEAPTEMRAKEIIDFYNAANDIGQPTFYC